MVDGADEADYRPYCLDCDRHIQNPIRVYRCPECGSRNITYLPVTDRQREEHALAEAGKALPFRQMPPHKYLFPRPPRGVPKALWEHIRPLRFLAIPILMLVFGAPTALIASIVIEGRQVPGVPTAPRTIWARSLHRCFTPALLLGNGGIILIPYLAKRQLRRFEQEIVADNYERCLECGYPLKGLPEKHRCPECGEPYDIAVVKKTWERYFEAQRTKK